MEGRPVSLRDWALGYAAKLQLAVFPLRPGAKEPRTGRGFKDATTDAEIIGRWWDAVPQSNVGMPIPPGYVVLDVDSESALQALGYQDLELPATVTTKTPRGWHFWYRTETHIPPAVGIIEGVDVRGPGSYVVVPPSKLSSGERYTWQVPPQPGSFADVPSWLVELATHKPFLVAEGQGINPAEVLSGVGEGSRDVTLFRYASRLRALGYDRAEAEVLVGHAASACVPPVSKAVAARKVESAWRYDGPTTAPSEVRIWTLPELLSTDFPAPNWIISEILPEGLGIMFSPAKVGKSFLVGAACVAIANGGVFIQGFNTVPSRVLYLDLEQGASFAKARWISILGVKPQPAGLTTAFSWPRMDMGGLDMIQKQLEENPDLRLIVIDVLAMFWPEKGSKGGENAYIWEYRVLSQIRDLAQKFGVAVVLVHHTNRSSAADPLDRASGTNAMTGVPETIWVLNRERNSDNGTLYVNGKNVAEQTLDLRFDAGSGGWTLLVPRFHAHSEYLGGEFDVLGGH